MQSYWKKTMTDQYRYDRLGVFGFMCDYARNHSKDKLVVADVGCSSGTAIRECKFNFKEKQAISLSTYGCDISEKAKYSFEESKRRDDPYGLDEFFHGPVCDMPMKYVGSVDMVICANMVRFVDGQTRAKVIRDCCRLLKHDGILITDAGRYYRWGSRKSPNSKEFSSVNTRYPGSVYGGMRKFINQFRNLLEPREMFTINKTDGLSYADSIEMEWNRFPQIIQWVIINIINK